MNSVKRILTIAIISGAAFLSACTDAKPEVSFLAFPQTFELLSSQIATASLTSITVKGSCSSFITGIDLSFDAGTTWTTLADYDASSLIECATTKTFSVTLSNSKSPWNGMTISAGQALAVKFRAHSSATAAELIASLTINYNPAVSISQETLVGSSLAQSGGSFNLHSRVRYQQQEIATGGAYILKGRIAQ
jgi:hypothetical protein